MDIERIVASSPDSHRRVFPIEIDGRRFWVKRIVKNLPNAAARWFYKAASRITGRGPNALADHEIERIATLKRHGYLTPEVVFRNPDYFVLTDIGPTLQEVIAAGDPAESGRLARLAGETLRGLHDQGHWHGAARIYNMTVSGGRIGFIDLENTVDTWLPRPVRKFWDLWQLGHSLALLEPSVQLSEAGLRGYGDGPVRRALWICAAALFIFYVALRPFRTVVKRELRQTLGCMEAIYRLHRKPAE